MHMMDWNAYRDQVAAGVGGLAKLSPDTVKGYGQLGQANARTGSLGAKTRELIALAVAISLRCDGCIATHTAAAKKAGATRGNCGGARRRHQRQCRCGTRLFHTYSRCVRYVERRLSEAADTRYLPPGMPGGRCFPCVQRR